ncbi:hypothetical protein PInf_003270 [Phytophthora infestans]|nr:hypothetical protein PInf_003270 [Phytophthora infestans]
MCLALFTESRSMDWSPRAPRWLLLDTREDPGGSESFWARGHLQAVRAKSKIAFITLHELTATIQGILRESDRFSVPDSPVLSTAQKSVELNVEKFFVVSKTLPELPSSPQKYKQMACAAAGLERVFEIGPVFCAENSSTHRHMCEFVGLDLEMTIKEHYHEVLEVFSDLYIYIFDGLKERYANELATINNQYPFEPLKYIKPSLIINF